MNDRIPDWPIGAQVEVWREEINDQFPYIAGEIKKRLGLRTYLVEIGNWTLTTEADILEIRAAGTGDALGYGLRIRRGPFWPGQPSWGVWPWDW